MEVTSDPATGADEYISVRQIIEAVERLLHAQQAGLRLVAVEGLSYDEAAKVLDVPVGTVMSRLSRARKTIGVCVILAPDELPQDGLGTAGHGKKNIGEYQPGTARGDRSVAS
jgi:RNA polymerase sigma-70 factor (ECF subfamily)